MQSAFGVEHGEIAKGFKIVRTPGRLLPRGTRGPNGKKLTGAQARTANVSGEPSRARQNYERMKTQVTRAANKPVSVASVGRGASKASRATTNWIERHPAATGAGILAGGGTAGYALSRPKEPKRGS